MKLTIEERSKCDTNNHDYPGLLADGAASDRHAGQLPAVAVADLDPAVLLPAVVAEDMAALHGRRLALLDVAEAGAACDFC